MTCTSTLIGFSHHLAWTGVDILILRGVRSLKFLISDQHGFRTLTMASTCSFMLLITNAVYTATAIIFLGMCQTWQNTLILC